MLVISNDQIRSLLTMKGCMSALEESYMERFHHRALSRPRSDLYAAKGDNLHYVFKSMEGLLPVQNTAALRINSDTIQWRKTPEGTRKEKLPLADGNWVGLVFLFDMTNGKLAAIMPDGVIQGFRVAATAGLAIDYMAKADAKTLGLFGAGWQAETQVLAACAVRKLEQIKVYSPTKHKREEFAARMSKLVGVPVIPVERPEEAAIGMDIVATTTNSITPVVKREWITPGTHLSCVKHVELGDDVISLADFVAIHSTNLTPENYMMATGEEKSYGHDPVENKEHTPSSKGWEESEELHTIVGGGVKARSNPNDITCFINNIGLGLQFAAVGALVLRLAKEAKLGHELPDEWFTEDVHP